MLDELGAESFIGQVSEVQLKNADIWHAVSTRKTSKRCIAKLSLGLCKDKKRVLKNCIASPKRLLFLITLHIYSRYNRYRWRF
jgi:hypothetical protein